MTPETDSEGSFVQALIEDYLQRALLRRQILQFFLQRQSYADVVRDSRAIVDLTMMAVMFGSNVSIPRDAITQERLPADDVKNIFGISSLLEKERMLASASPGSIMPSKYFTEEDARMAIHMTDRTLALFVPQLAPKLSMQLAEKAAARPGHSPGHH